MLGEPASASAHSPGSPGIRRSLTTAWVMLGSMVLAFAGAACVDASTEPATSTLIPDIEAVSLARGADDSLLWAERKTGRIMRWSDGDISEVAKVEVSDEGQRGLLGIAELGGAMYAAWTRPDERLVVAQVSPGPERLVWSGFESKKGGNGGRLLLTADGQILIGVGTLLNSSLTADPDEINGKILRLDPQGLPDQEPAVVSSGWNNPFAIVMVDEPDGDRLWVADNHPSDGEERLTWGGIDRDGNDRPVTVLPDDSAPTGLATIDGRLYVCAYNTRAIYRYNTNVSGRAVRAGTVAEDCRFDVVALGDRLVYAAEDSIMVIDRVG